MAPRADRTGRQWLQRRGRAGWDVCACVHLPTHHLRRLKVAAVPSRRAPRRSHEAARAAVTKPRAPQSRSRARRSHEAARRSHEAARAAVTKPRAPQSRSRARRARSCGGPPRAASRPSRRPRSRSSRRAGTELARGGAAASWGFVGPSRVRDLARHGRHARTRPVDEQHAARAVGQHVGGVHVAVVHLHDGT